jgi:hypothetical protein
MPMTGGARFPPFSRRLFMSAPRPLAVRRIPERRRLPLVAETLSSR